MEIHSAATAVHNFLITNKAFTDIMAGMEIISKPNQVCWLSQLWETTHFSRSLRSPALQPDKLSQRRHYFEEQE